MSHSIRALLATMLGPESLASEGELEHWRTGEGDGGLPSAVVAPSTEEELARVLARSSEEGWRVLPAGQGRWLKGGGPSNVALVLSTRRMREVLEYEPADLTFTAEAGLSLAALREATGPQGQWLPLDPPGGFEGTLGAAVALGTGGPLRQMYGTPRDHVLGLTLVSGDGRVLRWGGKVVKNVAGFDLTRLSIGSWGSLGVVTSVSARLFPIPEVDVTLTVPGPDVSTLLPSARAMALSSLPLAAVELVDPLPNGMELQAAGGKRGEPGMVLRLLGSRAQVAEMEKRVRSDLSGDLGPPRKLEGEGSRAYHGGLGTWEEGSDLVARLCLFPSEMGSLLDEAREMGSLLSRTSGVAGRRVRLSGHVGAGVVRVAVSGMPNGKDESGTWASALQDLRGRLEEIGGSLTLSSAPDSVVRAIGAWGAASGAEKRLMAGLKAQFDPKGIMAPGRLGL